MKLWFFLGMINFWGIFIWICKVFVWNKLSVCFVFFIFKFVLILVKMSLFGFFFCIIWYVFVKLVFFNAVEIDFVVIKRLVFLVIMFNCWLIFFVCWLLFVIVLI